MGLFNKVAKVSTEASNGSGIKARQESARAHLGAKGGGLLGRLAGRNGGQEAVYKGKSKSGNSGSMRFRQMQASSDLGYDPSQCSDSVEW